LEEKDRKNQEAEKNFTKTKFLILLQALIKKIFLEKYEVFTAVAMTVTVCRDVTS